MMTPTGLTKFYSAVFTTEEIYFSTTNSVGKAYKAYLVGDGKDF